MTEKVIEAPRDERFGFILTINDNIVCKRTFGINNFQERSIGSILLSEAMKICADLITNDLKEKTNIYNELTAPRVFQNNEEMREWVKKSGEKLEVPSFVMLRDSEEVYVWDGKQLNLYDKPFNRFDYFDEEVRPLRLRLSFLYNGEEVRYYEWLGPECPKFVRNNIDLSNSKNKYEQEGNFSPFEAYIINQFNKGRQDIILAIKRRFIYACNGEDLKYYSRLHYGDKEYDVNLRVYNERLFLKKKK